MQRDLDAASSWRPIALAAIHYVDGIDAPNPHEPWDIAKRRDALVDVVHARQGRPERTRRDPQVLRPLAPVVPINRFLAQPLPPQRETRTRAPSPLDAGPSREQLVRDLEMKRRALHDAGAKYGAEANKRRRDRARVAELAAALDTTAAAVARAEGRLRAFDRCIAREAM